MKIPASGGRLAEVLHGLLSAMLRNRPRDMTMTAASVLSTLDRCGPTRLGELAAREAVTQPSMTAIVDHFERLGLAERRHDVSDARVVLVTITPAGRARLSERRRVWADLLESVLVDLTADEMAALEKARPALEHLAYRLGSGPSMPVQAGASR